MKITFLTVGGRTSAVVPDVQKKTGPASTDKAIESDMVSEKANPSVLNVKSTKNEKTTSRKRTASGAAMSSKPPEGKKRHSNDVSDAKEVNYDTIKLTLREELKQDLKEELLSELKQELKQQIKVELKQVHNEMNGLKRSVSQMSSTTDYQSKRDSDIENNVAVSDSSRRRSARLNG